MFRRNKAGTLMLLLSIALGAAAILHWKNSSAPSESLQPYTPPNLSCCPAIPVPQRPQTPLFFTLAAYRRLPGQLQVDITISNAASTNVETIIPQIASNMSGPWTNIMGSIVVTGSLPLTEFAFITSTNSAFCRFAVNGYPTQIVPLN